MMWAPTVPTTTPVKKGSGFWYRCDNCSDSDITIYGFGRQCWSCRRRKILVKNVSVPCWTAWHRNDPTNDRGDTPSCGRVPFEGEAASLL